MATMPAPSDFLHRLEEAPLHMVERIGRYTRFVSWAKVLLFVAVVGLIALVCGILLFNKHGDRMRIVFSSIAQSAAELPIMLHPRFEGVDANDQPYRVTADEATQTSENGQDVVHMKQLNADLSTKNGGWMNLTAARGRLIMAKKELILEGDVSLYQDTGYELHTPRTLVDLGTLRAYGQDGVEGQGTTGTIRAQRFVFDQKKAAARFDGAVQVTLYPKSQ